MFGKQITPYACLTRGSNRETGRMPPEKFCPLIQVLLALNLGMYITPGGYSRTQSDQIFDYRFYSWLHQQTFKIRKLLNCKQVTFSVSPVFWCMTVSVWSSNTGLGFRSAQKKNTVCHFLQAETLCCLRCFVLLIVCMKNCLSSRPITIERKRG